MCCWCIHPGAPPIRAFHSLEWVFNISGFSGFRFERKQKAQLVECYSRWRSILILTASSRISQELSWLRLDSDTEICLCCCRITEVEQRAPGAYNTVGRRRCSNVTSPLVWCILVESRMVVLQSHLIYYSTGWPCKRFFTLVPSRNVSTSACNPNRDSWFTISQDFHS